MSTLVSTMRKVHYMPRGRKKKDGTYLDILRREVFESIPRDLLEIKWTYSIIQDLADNYLNCPMQDLCGLDTGNDPFYCGMPAQVRDAKWLSDWWSKIVAYARGKVSPRTAHYYLASVK